MDNQRFDAWTKALTADQTSRRTTLLSMSSAALGVLLARFSDNAIAKKRKNKKKRKKKLKKNEFGCVDIGGKCRGSDGACCSGVCQGKKPKKGKKDKSVCVDHNVGGCTLDRDICVTGDGQESACGTAAVCAQTTGNAAFCASQENVDCRICSTDRDCEAQGFPIGSACIILTGGECVGEDNDCNGVSGSSGTACAGPGA
jgi:hypothetical protein